MNLKSRHADVFELIFGACALTSVVVLFLIIIFTLKNAVPAFYGRLLTFENLWAAEYNRFGLYTLVASTAMVSVGSLAISTPTGVLSAVFIAKFTPSYLRDVFKTVVEFLGMIPSVIYGFIGYMFLAPTIAKLFGLNFGQNALSASIVLAVMVVPTIVSLSTEVIMSVPREYEEAAMALGARGWQTLLHVTIPTAMPGIVSSVMLAFGRALGETIAVLMVAGCPTRLSGPVWNFLQPVYPMTAAIAMGMGEAEVGGVHYHALFAVAAILLAFVFVVNFAADILRRRAPRRIVV